MKVENLEDIYALSPLQQGMLFHSLFDPAAGLYFEQITFVFESEIDPAALERAWQQVVDRHAALRTSFHWEALEKPVQVVHQRAKLPFRVEDWRRLPRVSQEQRLARLLEQDRERGFDLDQAPLLRLTLIRLSDAAYNFLLSFHHLVLDGWSLHLVLREAFLLHEAHCGGRRVALDPVRPYSDYIAWLREQDLSEAERFWRRVLSGYAGPPPLPTDGSADVQQTYHERRHTVSRSTTAALQAVARSQQLTMNTLLQAAWAILLSRYTDNRDIVFGATISGRPPALKGVESMVGLFINTLPVRVLVSPEAKLTSFLKELQRQQFEARQFEYTPLVQIREWTQAPAGKPLFETLLVFENYPVSDEHSDQSGSDAAQVGVVERVNYPLSIVVAPGLELCVRVLYWYPRFNHDTIERLLAHFDRILESLTQNPARLDQVQLLTEPERRQLLLEWNDTATPYPRDACVHGLFEQQAECTPEAVAIVDGARQLSYGELNRLSSRLAQYLRRLGVGPETLVGLCLERSAEMIIAMLGIFKAGGAYVPLDPAYPQERLRFMLEDTGALVLVTEGRLRGALPCQDLEVVCMDSDWDIISSEAKGDVGVAVPADGLAYVMYTSGSTGTPKGVSVLHRGIVRLVRDTNYIAIEPSDRVAQASNASFDAATFEIWGALLNGARVVVIPRDVTLAPREFAAQLQRDGVSVVFLTTELFNQTVRETPEAFCALRSLMVGGSALDPKWIGIALERGRPRHLLNVYGPTESTTFATYYPIDEAPEGITTIPIGRPVSNTEIYILDSGLNLMPAGVAGELYVGGDGLARGYWNRPELTAERFIRHPFCNDPGARLYRTGDLARYGPDGNIQFLGRRDHQVKIRGFRVELGEIEWALRQHSAVGQAAVVVREDERGEKRLVAYVSVVSEPAPTRRQLREHLRSKLPGYMLPSAYVLLEALPLTPNGKVDRRALPEPEWSQPELERVHIPPRNAVEETVAGIWGEVLKVHRVGVEDNFFELGGHSLLATQVISRVRDALQIKLPLRTIFATPTVEGLAAAIDQAKRTGEEVREPAISHLPREPQQIERRGLGAGAPRLE